MINDDDVSSSVQLEQPNDLVHFKLHKLGFNHYLDFDAEDTLHFVCCDEVH